MAGIAILNEGYILALRLNTFPRYVYAESLGTDSTTSSTYQDKATLTLSSTQNFPHLILSSSLMSSGSTTDSVVGQVTQNGTSFSNISNEGLSDLPNYMLGSSYKVSSSSAQEFIYKTQYASRLAAGASMFIRESKILALQIEDDATVWVKGGVILGGVIK